MTAKFSANGLPTLIGSLPNRDHDEAVRLVLEHTPEIPPWVQLPVYPQERMVPQFAPGVPGLRHRGDRLFVDRSAAEFDAELLQFYDEYLAVSEDRAALETSRFVLQPDVAPGLFKLIEAVEQRAEPPRAVKGQITGPFTFATGLTDQDKRALFYDEQLRDVVVKLLAMKAAWQVRRLSGFGCPVILFIDEPALAGVGSSEFISVSREDLAQCLSEIIDAVHAEGGLAGVHVCANTDWSLVLESPVDIVSFDAYSYFERFILFAAQLKRFLAAGKIIAWGIVPTLRGDDIGKESVDSLTRQWQEKLDQVAALGFTAAELLAQSLITPSCGAGSLSLDQTMKVLRLTQGVSERIRREFAG
jgi:methionine synthase II (cobalamin-independent)